MPDRSNKLCPLPLAVVIVLGIFSVCSLAQSASTQTPPASTTTYRVAGRIVSAINGRPLQRATVQLLNPDAPLQNSNGEGTASTTSDEDGRFALTGVTAGLHNLQGSADGYLTSCYDAHEQFCTGIVAGAGVDTESLLLKLTPEATLSGHVTDEAGDPVRNANVRLYRENRDQGYLRILPAIGSQTNDLGEFVIGDLQPGTYYLLTTVLPWYAVHPRPAPPGQQVYAQVSVVDSLDPSLDVAYPTIFYPEATDSSGAEAIPVRAAEQRNIDLRLFPVPAVTVTIPKALDDKNAGQVRLEQKIFGQFEPFRFASSNESTITGVPPGEYRLQQSGTSPGGTSRSVQLSLTAGNTSVSAIGGQELGNVKVQLKASDGGNLPANLRLALMTKDGSSSQWSQVNEKGEAEVNGLDSGAYSLAISQNSQSYYVVKAISDGRPVSAYDLPVKAGASLSLTALVAPISGSLKGIAQKDGKPAAGVLILLLPIDPSLRRLFSFRDQSNLDGSFEFRRVPPGRYTVIAIEDGWDLEWAKEDALARYLPLGVSVGIPASGSNSIKLPDPVTVQPH
jgi:hypothetical protein